MANVLTPYFRVSYPKVFKAEKNDLNGKDEFSVMALFPKGADLTLLKKAAQEALVEKFGADQKKWPANLKNPFRKQEEKFKIDEATGKTIIPNGMEEGGIFMTLRSTQKPGVVDANNQDIIVESEFYGGCWARAAVSAYAYEAKGNRGVSFGLRHIQKWKDGDALGSRTKPQDDFAPIDTGSAVASGGDATSLFG